MPLPRRSSGRGQATPLVAALLAVCALSFLAVPVAVLVGRAVLGGSLAGEAGDPALGSAIVLSLGTTAASLLLTVTFGTPLAFLLARRRWRGRSLVEALIDLPVVLPPAVAGLALLLALGRNGLFGGLLHDLGIELPFTTGAVVLAQTFVSAPFFVRSARTGFAAVPPDLEDAARVDGGSEASVFRLVTVPLASSALAAGLVLSWARALGEFGATIMFAGNVQGLTQTLPLLVYGEFQSSLDASIAAAAILVVAAFGVLVAIRLVHWRSAVELRSVL
ncbi:MAG TPA: ABC transporter permease [Candidatus Baltobacteraceae bacterium]|nr:ABC transporter permease [Candidatus Baltobacteraceae bacterium]